MEPNILRIEFHKQAPKEDADRLWSYLLDSRDIAVSRTDFPTPTFSITIDTDDKALKIRHILQLNLESRWSISGPLCTFHPQTMDAVSIGWRCFWKGCDHIRYFSEDPTLTARQFLEKCRLMVSTDSLGNVSRPPRIKPSLERRFLQTDKEPFVPMNHVISPNFEREVLGKYVSTAAGPFDAARQAEAIRQRTHKTGDHVAKLSEWEPFQDTFSQNKELKNTADKLVRVVAGLNLQDHPITTQREVREALSAVMKVLKNGQEPR